MKRLYIIFLSSLFTSTFLPPSLSRGDQGTSEPSLQPVHHIMLRVHLGRSNRAPGGWVPILEEINSIWHSQAGICFDMHTVAHDEILDNGLDLWFEATIPGWNGYFTDPNDIHVRDDPDLRPAEIPARSSAARTAAHELGHALGLPHRQESDDNLMRSKTYGWKLHPDEIITARAAAARMASDGNEKMQCSTPSLHDHP